ncbi:EAL domain-containing protein [Paucimonas lemoignei]|nr:EAL domain-containing protein [Paucimonas lemoignei]
MDPDSESHSIDEPDFHAFFDAIPVPCLVLTPDFTIVAANEAYLRITQASHNDVIGRNIFDIFPDNQYAPPASGTHNLRTSLLRVMQDKTSNMMPIQRYDITVERDGKKVVEEHYWSPVNSPVFDSNGNISHIFHCAEDVTQAVWTKARIAGTGTGASDEVQAPQQAGVSAGARAEKPEPGFAARTKDLLQEREYIYSLVRAIPVPCTVMLGKDHRYWLQNKAHRDLTGHFDIIGKPYHETFPATAEWELPILDHVFQHGQPYHIERKKLTFGKNEDGTSRDLYLALSWQPFFGSDNTVVGVISTATDITEQVRTESKLRESEEFYRIATDAANIGTWNVFLDKQVADLSPRLAAMMGLPPDRQRYSFDEMLEVTHAEDRERLLKAMQRAWETGSIYEEKIRINFPNGEKHTLFSRAKVFLDEDGKPLSLRGAAIDLTEQLRAEEQLRTANDMLSLAVEGVGEGIWEWDPRNRTVYYSERAKEILGYAPEDSPSYRMLWPSRVHPDDLRRVSMALREHIEGKVPTYICEYRAKCKNGDFKWVLSRGIVVARDANGKPLRMTGMFSDISDRKEADEHIWRLANFDILTGLPNRRLFRDRLEQDVNQASRNHHKLALLFIDLDRFKQVNDSLGHEAGDLLLRHAAKRIQECVRDTDTVARLGGDEFTVILNELHHEHDRVEQICEKILQALSQPFSLGAEPTGVSASIGIALYPDDAKTHDELLRKVDQAMYSAKQAGKNRFAYFTREMDENAHRRHRVMNELRRALQEKHFELYFQPVIELATGRIWKAEALIRWRHPELGFIAPSQFIPLAEESGLIDEISDWVFQQAVTYSRQWSELIKAPFQIAVNKSPVQFSLPKKDAWIDFLHSEGGTTPHIVVEITEGLLMQTSSQVTNLLQEYKAAGMQVAIDDFGTGYSSMAYLKRFDIDYLKIDQSFVRDMTTDPTNKTITDSMIAMAHKLGIKVIAEGVETPEQQQLLSEAGCDYAQGYLYSPPCTASHFESMLVSRNPGNKVQSKNTRVRY